MPWSQPQAPNPGPTGQTGGRAPGINGGGYPGQLPYFGAAGAYPTPWAGLTGSSRPNVQTRQATPDLTTPQGVGAVPGGSVLPVQSPNGVSAVPGGSMANSVAGGGPTGSNDVLGRMESYFGPLGTPTSALQQQSLGGIGQFLSSNPYGQSNNALNQILTGGTPGFGQAQGAMGDAAGIFKGLAGFNPYGQAMSTLNGQLGTNPGQAVMDALQPMLQRSLAAANQVGGRFGSANALRDATAIQDNQLLAAQALQQGITQQQNAASVLGALGNSLGGFQQAGGQGLLGVGQGLGNLGVQQGQLQLGAAGQLSQNQNNMFNALQGAYGTGTQQAQQDAQRQQQALAILQNILGASFGATLGVPSSVQPTGAQQGAQIGSSAGQILAMQNGGMVPNGAQSLVNNNFGLIPGQYYG